MNFGFCMHKHLRLCTCAPKIHECTYANTLPPTHLATQLVADTDVHAGTHIHTQVCKHGHIHTSTTIHTPNHTLSHIWTQVCNHESVHTAGLSIIHTVAKAKFESLQQIIDFVFHELCNNATKMFALLPQEYKKLYHLEVWLIWSGGQEGDFL